MKKVVLLICIAIMGMAQLANASPEYQYMPAKDLKWWLEEAQSVMIVDIQEKKAFTAHHVRGAIETNAYPVKSEADRQKLMTALRQIQAKEHKHAPVVIVCPRGKGGAKRTYDYLKSQGVSETRLFILTGGMKDWPYKKWVDTQIRTAA